MNIQNTPPVTLISDSPPLTTGEGSVSTAGPLDQSFWSMISSQLGLTQGKTGQGENSTTELDVSEKTIHSAILDSNDLVYQGSTETAPRALIGRAQPQAQQGTMKSIAERVTTSKEDPIAAQIDMSMNLQGLSATVETAPGITLAATPESNVSPRTEIPDAFSPDVTRSSAYLTEGWPNITSRQVALTSFDMPMHSDGKTLQLSDVSIAPASGKRVAAIDRGATIGSTTSEGAANVDTVNVGTPNAGNASVGTANAGAASAYAALNAGKSTFSLEPGGEALNRVPLNVAPERAPNRAEVTVTREMLLPPSNQASAERVAGLRPQPQSSAPSDTSSNVMLASTALSPSESASPPTNGRAANEFRKAYLRPSATVQAYAEQRSTAGDKVMRGQPLEADAFAPESFKVQHKASALDPTQAGRRSLANNSVANWQSLDLQLQTTGDNKPNLGIVRGTVTHSTAPPFSGSFLSVQSSADSEAQTAPSPLSTSSEDDAVKANTLPPPSAERQATKLDSNLLVERFHTTSFNAKVWSNDASQRISMMVARNLESAEIQIDPPELGPISVRVAMHNDQLSLQFLSPHGQVRDFIEQHMNQLERLLDEQGLELGTADVSAGSNREEGAKQDAERGSPIIDEDEDNSAGKLTESPGDLASQGNIDTFI